MTRQIAPPDQHLFPQTVEEHGFKHEFGHAVAFLRLTDAEQVKIDRCDRAFQTHFPFSLGSLHPLTAAVIVAAGPLASAIWFGLIPLATTGGDPSPEELYQTIIGGADFTNTESDAYLFIAALGQIPKQYLGRAIYYSLNAAYLYATEAAAILIWHWDAAQEFVSAIRAGKQIKLTRMHLQFLSERTDYKEILG